MNIGIVSSWNSQANEGLLVANGNSYQFAYTDGRTLISTTDQSEPDFGTHAQPVGFELKKPRVGEALVFKASDSSINWAYAEHYISAITRKTPSAFRDAQPSH